MELILLIIGGGIVLWIFDLVSNFFGKEPTVLKELKESTKKDLQAQRAHGEIRAQIERTKLLNELAQTRSRLPKEVLEQMHKTGEIDSLELVTALNIKEQNERVLQSRPLTPDFDFIDLDVFNSNVPNTVSNQLDYKPNASLHAALPKLASTSKYKFCTKCGGRGMLKYRHIEKGKCFSCGRIPNQRGTIIR
jgi:hypothetical protein